MKRERQNSARKSPGKSGGTGRGPRATDQGSRFTVCVVTGSRAEFGIWRPVLRAIQESQKLRLKLLVTGTHLTPQFGKTEWQIEGNGSQIDARVPMYKPGEPAAKSLARGTEGMAKAMGKLRPHLVMVLGDRLEMLAAASAALAQRIPIAHVHGGETAPGIWDEQIRHAITKMAHVHFCATSRAGERIQRMGEDPKQTHVVGAPALDWAVHESKINARIHHEAPRDTWPLIVLHPSSADGNLEYRRTHLLLKVLQKVFRPTSGRRLAVIGPNNDPGHEGILRAYRHSTKIAGLQSSVSQDLFWAALSGSGLLIGNSSSGIIEAATFGCAVINIGDRQAGRERSGNVIDVPWEGSSGGAASIEKAIRKALTDRKFGHRVALRKNVYGDGRASERIVKVLEQVARTGISTVKRFHDR